MIFLFKNGRVIYCLVSVRGAGEGVEGEEAVGRQGGGRAGTFFHDP